MHAHSFAWRDLPDLLSFVACNAASRGADQIYLMTSDIAWQIRGSAPEENLRLWRDDAGLAAYGWYQPPDTILFDVRADLTDADALRDVILAWAESRRPAFPAGYPFHIDLTSMPEWAAAIRQPKQHPLAGNRYVVTTALESDRHRQTLLRDRGYERTKHFEPILIRDLSDLPAPDPLSGFTVRAVDDEELDARVALHAAAWAPSSGFNLSRYLEIRSMSEVYDPELDLVAAAPDGTLASYTIAWQDAVSGIGSFEPFGTHPGFRGSGVSRLVMEEGLRRLADRGMSFARVYTAGFNHPACRLYRSCGFREIDRYQTWTKRLGEA